MEQSEKKDNDAAERQWKWQFRLAGPMSLLAEYQWI